MRIALGIVIVAACGGTSPPPEPLSSKVIEPVQPPVIVSLTSARDAMCACRDPDCAHAAIDQLRTWSKERKPDPATVKQVDALLATYAPCITGIATGAPADYVGSPWCDAYEFRIVQVMTCDELPAETKQALEESFKQTVLAWASVPDEGKAALNTACKSAADALEQAAASCQK